MWVGETCFTLIFQRLTTFCQYFTIYFIMSKLLSFDTVYLAVMIEIYNNNKMPCILASCNFFRKSSDYLLSKWQFHACRELAYKVDTIVSSCKKEGLIWREIPKHLKALCTNYSNQYSVCLYLSKCMVNPYVIIQFNNLAQIVTFAPVVCSRCRLLTSAARQALWLK